MFLEQETDHLGTKSNRGSKIESPAVFRLRIFLSLEFIVVAIGIPRSLKFIKQLELVQKQKLKVILWRRAYKKLH